MPKVFKASEASGKCAIYDVADLASVPTGPLTDPDSNASVLHFHSDWYYPRVVGADHTGTVTLPAGAANTFQNGTLTLFAHGQSDVPMVFGSVTVGGITLALAGDVCLNRNAITGGGTFATGNRTWLSLEVDATNVYLRYYGGVRFGAATAALAVTYSVQVTDMLVTGAGPVEDPAEPVVKYSDSTGILTMGRGKINTVDRYLKRGSGSGVQIVRSQTTQIITRVTANNSIQNGYFAVYGYHLNGYKAPKSIFGDDPAVTINPSFDWAAL